MAGVFCFASGSNNNSQQALSTVDFIQEAPQMASTQSELQFIANSIATAGSHREKTNEGSCYRCNGQSGR